MLLSEKSFQPIYGIFVLFFLILSDAIFMLNPAYADPPKSEARLLYSTGKVEVKSFNSDVWTVAKQGFALGDGTEIRTNDGSVCELSIDSAVGSAVRIKANSTAVLSSLNPVKIGLKSGSIMTLVRGLQKGKEFKVVTPTAVASARGAGWAQSVDGIHVFEGNVNIISSKGQQIIVPEGKQIRITRDGVMGSADSFSLELKNEWREFKNISEGLQKSLALMNRPKEINKTPASAEKLTGQVPTENYAVNQPFSIVSLGASKPDSVTFYQVSSRKSDIILPGMVFVGNECVICAKGGSEITVKPVGSPMESKRVIMGPASGMLSELYETAADQTHKKYTQTIIAVQEGAVLTSIIMHVGDKEVIVSSTLIKGDVEEKTPEEYGEAGSLKGIKKTPLKKTPLKKTDQLGTEFTPAVKKSPNVMVIDACGYVKAVYVPNINLEVNCAEKIQSDLNGGKVKSASSACSGKGPKVDDPPSSELLA